MSTSPDQILDSFLASPAPGGSPDPGQQQPADVIDTFTGGAAPATGMPETDETKARHKEEEQARKEEEKQAAEEERIAEEEREAQRGTLAGLANTVADTASSLNNRVASFPTPGGIGLLLFVLIIFVWMLVPTKNGYTRMQLLYLTLRDQTTLTGEFSGGTSGSSGGGFSTPVVVEGSGGAVPLSTPVIVTPLDPITGTTDFGAAVNPSFL